MIKKYAGGTAIGFVAGLTFGIVGWGGAQIIKPSLTSFLGISQIAANGASITSLSFASTVSSAKFFFSDQSDLRTAAIIALPGIIGARVGVRIAQRMSSDLLAFIFNAGSVVLIPTHFLVQQWRTNNPMADRTDREYSPLQWMVPPPSKEEKESKSKVLDLDLLYLSGDYGSESAPASGTTTTVLSRAYQNATSYYSAANAAGYSPNPMILQHGLFGVSMGVLSALMGVGGAPLTMSYLTVATQLPHHKVQGTMLLSTLPAILTSAFTLGMSGSTPLGITAAVCVGSSIGSSVGSSVALFLTEEQLRQLFMVSLVVLGGRSFISAVGNVRSFMKARKIIDTLKKK